MYKQIGLTSEEVCEIGKWKNTGAFTAHYLRVGATKRAAEKINNLIVHNVSSRRSAEPDWSRSPGTNRDLGRSDQEGEAQSLDETRHFVAGFVHCFWFGRSVPTGGLLSPRPSSLLLPAVGGS